MVVKEAMPMKQNASPAEELEGFLNFVDTCIGAYKIAYDAVNEEDRRLQDLVHAIEFAPDKSERNRAATRMQQSRRLRRKNKDIVQMNERLVKFFEDQNNRATLNRMRQLLGQQRKEEDFLKGKRVYKPRVEGK